MLTNNYKKLLRLSFLGLGGQYINNIIQYFNNDYNNFLIPTSGKLLSEVSGTMTPAYSFTYYGTLDNASISSPMQSETFKGRSNSIYILCGTGSTAESAEDYKLANQTTDITITQGSVASNGAFDCSKYIQIISANAENTSDASVTISEIGLYAAPTITINTATSSNQGDYTNFLIAREVLEEPITLQPGESTTITFSLE